MDPFSTAASALQIASFAGSLVKHIFRFVEQTRVVADSIRELYSVVGHLAAALRGIGEAFNHRPPQLSFEYRHHDQIYRILESCNNSLRDLEQELPQLQDETTPMQKLQLSIQKSLKGERLKGIIHHITSYQRILHLSLSTLTLGELWRNRGSQETILGEVRRINHMILETDIFSGRTETRARNIRELPAISTAQLDTSQADEEARSVLDGEIREWRETVDEIAAAVSLSGMIPHDESSDLSLHSTASSTTLQTFDDNDGESDSEPEEIDELSCKVMRLTLENNQKIVSQLRENGISFQAAEYQRRGIARRRRLNDVLVERGEQDDGFSGILRLTDMEETLADILFDCHTPQTDEDARKVLRELLERQREQETDDTDRQWRLHHKLGKLYVRQGNFRKSRKYLRTAFMGRSRADHRREDLIRESAEMLIKSLQALRLIDEARGIRSWLEEELPVEPQGIDEPSPRSSPRASVTEEGDFGSALRWSKDQGFDIHNPLFGFNVCDPETQNAPIHLAISQENFEVVRSMLSNIPHVEQRDSTGSSLLHIAATTRSKRVCAILLEKGADVDVIDQKGRTPLHRCQGSSGGIQVAELILNKNPDLLDRVDYVGKTALYMACEFGNEKMAAYLLSKGANPNIGGNRHFIPAKRQSIEAVEYNKHGKHSGFCRGIFSEWRQKRVYFNWAPWVGRKLDKALQSES
ncbi:hypothetical protein EKO27_g7378 [Xylaria grammica]|uniref:Uncharacterized protein n=1 Tax=Xylaria grammica TaxID=363999 RepID=A0A439D0A2_9PEZI|nr:hypothetical protein EKO27_g7378 [Xylaria grammica]